MAWSHCVKRYKSKMSGLKSRHCERSVCMRVSIDNSIDEPNKAIVQLFSIYQTRLPFWVIHVFVIKCHIIRCPLDGIGRCVLVILGLCLCMRAYVFFHHIIINHVPNKSAFIHYFNRLPLQWQHTSFLCMCVYSLSIPGMKTLSSNFPSAFGSNKHLDNEKKINTIQLKMKHNNARIIFVTFMEKNRRNISNSAVRSVTCLKRSSESLIARHKWRWLFYCNGRIICCRSLLSSISFSTNQHSQSTWARNVHYC